MKTRIKKDFLFQNIISKYSESKIFKLIFMLSLSWFYAICSQIIIPLPFNFVPISLQPLPLYLFSLLIGWPAVGAYFLCIFQTALGAPFFSGFEGGIIKLLGPTGGYIFGFTFAMIFLVLAKNYKKYSYVITFSKLFIANVILFFLGLLWLSFFVPSEKLLILGLTPFIFGNLLKSVFIIVFVVKYNSYKK